MKSIFLFILLIPSLVLFFGCQKKGPSSDSQQSDALNIQSTHISILASSVCKKIQTCAGLNESTTCYQQILSASYFTNELLINDLYKNLSEAIQAEVSGGLSINESLFTNCNASIQGLTCSDSLVSNSFSVTEPSDFSKTYLLFRSSDSCQNLKN